MIRIFHQQRKPSRWEHQVEGKDLVSDWTNHDTRKQFRDEVALQGKQYRALCERELRDPGNPELYTILDRQRFTLFPKSVNRAELDALIKGGAIELYRGIHPARTQTANSLANKLRWGTLYVSGGTYGSGIHTDASKPDESTAFMEEYSGEGVVLRMALNGANIIHIEKLEKMMKNDKAGDAGLLDPGKYAATKGFDAIQVVVPNYYVVLNRTALAIQTPNYQ